MKATAFSYYYTSPEHFLFRGIYSIYEHFKNQLVSFTIRFESDIRKWNLCDVTFWNTNCYTTSSGWNSFCIRLDNHWIKFTVMPDSYITFLFWIFFTTQCKVFVLYILHNTKRYYHYVQVFLDALGVQLSSVWIYPVTSAISNKIAFGYKLGISVLVSTGICSSRPSFPFEAARGQGADKTDSQQDKLCLYIT